MNYAATLVFLLDVPNPGQRISDVLNCNVVSMTQRISDVLNCNVVSMTQVRFVMNTSSYDEDCIATNDPKGFVNFFSHCLESEYRGEGITVQCVAPLLVSTNMTWNMGTNALVKRADDFAREALNTAGLSSFTSGCLSHALQHFVIDHLLPGWLRLAAFNVYQTATRKKTEAIFRGTCKQE
ncbi:very-long-chain 3-oxoacyl-CoA reductase-B isoform X2 [Huso huso]|uniref:Very-long-chain 3-oxoacyl-CoA reductase-B isoform X2 n=1 Tax=Huso huso TaxID=61971 RepID=A0ABR0Y2K2_HUSHU